MRSAAAVAGDRVRRVVVSGCSGGGKSTLLAALAARGYAVVEEAGRRVVRRALEEGSDAVPWRDAAAFAEAAIALAIADHEGATADNEGAPADHAGAASAGPPVFFDRSVIDVAAYRDSLTGAACAEAFAARYRYHDMVFIAPPWPELFAKDRERRHGMADALAEYERLCRVYPAAGYTLVELPKIPVNARVGFVLRTLGEPLPAAQD